MSEQGAPLPSGLLLIDKPRGMSSFDIIRVLRRQTTTRKIGHAGTLDPMATGLMIMLVNAATKQAAHFSGLDKTYTGEMTFGAVSTTGDKEGELQAVATHQPSLKELTAACEQLTGKIEQTPPQYSAIKVGGVRSYKLAREGKAVEIPSRSVTIHSFHVIDYTYPLVRFEAEVSSGTYIRTLAEDLGKIVGTGAYLSDLRRTTIGRYSIEDAQQLDAVTQASLEAHLLPATPSI